MGVQDLARVVVLYVGSEHLKEVENYCPLTLDSEVDMKDFYSYFYLFMCFS